MYCGCFSNHKSFPFQRIEIECKRILAVSPQTAHDSRITQKWFEKKSSFLIASFESKLRFRFESEFTHSRLRENH